MVIHRSGMRPGEFARVLPCDRMLPDAEIVIDRATTLPAPPENVWPWLLGIGKDRAGWYWPHPIERLLPRGGRGDRTLNPAYRDLAVGDKVGDWGPRDPKLEVVVLDPPHDLGFRSTRGRATITWELNIRADDDATSRLHLRLRIDRPHDRFTPVITYAGGLFDWLTVIGLFAGLRERVTTSTP